jgi:hypothetical protein
MAIFNSYVKLPEGTPQFWDVISHDSFAFSPDRLSSWVAIVPVSKIRPARRARKELGGDAQLEAGGGVRQVSHGHCVCIF